MYGKMLREVIKKSDRSALCSNRRSRATFRIVAESERSADGISFGANLYIGYGFNEQSMLAFRYRYTWIDTDSPYQGLLWSPDYRYYLSKEGRFYLNGGIGPAMSIPEFGDPKSGFGFYGGVGYEITKYIYLTADFTYTSLRDNMSGTAILASVSFIKY